MHQSNPPRIREKTMHAAVELSQKRPHFIVEFCILAARKSTFRHFDFQFNNAARSRIKTVLVFRKMKQERPLLGNGAMIMTSYIHFP